MNDNDLLEFPIYRLKLNKKVVQDSHPKCKHPDGKLCPANVTGKCIALSNADFGNKLCPFFKNSEEMSVKDLAEYKRVYRGKRGSVFGNS